MAKKQDPKITAVLAEAITSERLHAEKFKLHKPYDAALYVRGYLEGAGYALRRLPKSRPSSVNIIKATAEATGGGNA